MTSRLNLDSLIFSTVAAVFAAALAAGPAHAGESVKNGGPEYNKPGRQIDEDGNMRVKTGGPNYKAGRTIDEDGKRVKAGGPDYKIGRALDEDGQRVKTGGPDYKAGRAVDEDGKKVVKTAGTYDKPGRTIDDGTVKANKPKKYGRAIDTEKGKQKGKKPVVEQ